MSYKGKCIGLQMIRNSFTKHGGITPENQNEKQLADSSSSGTPFIRSEMNAIDHNYDVDYPDEEKADQTEQVKVSGLPGFDRSDNYEFVEEKTTGHEKPQTSGNPQARDTENVWDEHESFENVDDITDFNPNPGPNFA